MTNKKVTPGQKASAPSAQFHNDLVDLLNAQKLGGNARLRQGHHTPKDFCLVKARNSSGGNVRRGEVLEFTAELLTDKEQQYPWFTGDLNSGDYPGWGITRWPIPSGEIDEVVCVGVCLAYVDVLDIDHPFADRKISSLTLESGETGAVKIISPLSGTGEQLLWVQLMDFGGSGIRLLRGITNEYMGATTAWAVEVSVGWFQGTDPGGTVVVHDPDRCWVDVPSASDVLAFYNETDDRWEVLHAERVYYEARAVLDDPLCAETSAIAISSFMGLEAADFLQPPDTTPTVAINPRMHAGLSGDGITLRRANNDPDDPIWEIVDVDHHAVDVVVDVYLDGIDLTQKKRTIYIEACDTDETPSTIDTGTNCP